MKIKTTIDLDVSDFISGISDHEISDLLLPVLKKIGIRGFASLIRDLADHLDWRPEDAVSLVTSLPVKFVDAQDGDSEIWVNVAND
jgi:hypothetical protein